jgi:hypothetical protein
MNTERNKSEGISGAFYGLGFVGAIVYFISTASSFGSGAIGVLKALVWPGILVYEVLKYMNA